jgi:hypothetical protein
VPTGNTEFHFQTGDPRFKSSFYQWLVVAGPRAQFKAWGSINGEGDYAFMLTARDGEANGGGGFDRFRIKILEEATGVVSYDNQAGSDDDPDPTDATIIQGGSIVVHKAN